MPKTRNGKQSVHRLSHRVAFNVLWIQSLLCRLGRFLVWGLHASQASGAGHSSFSILHSPASASQLWTWHSQLPVFRMLCPRLCATVSFLPFRFDFKCQLSTVFSHYPIFKSPSIVPNHLCHPPLLPVMQNAESFGSVLSSWDARSRLCHDSWHIVGAEIYFLHELVKRRGQ